MVKSMGVESRWSNIMNIINAIVNFANNPISEIHAYSPGRNSANNMGKALEDYVQDLFANTFTQGIHERDETLNNVFSYLGNQNNPPDAMLWDGDAIEVKKIESFNSTLALNSSYPKHTLKVTNPLISTACRNAEEWEEKDMLYVVGVVQQQTLKHLSMVYGLNYCASDECYSNIRARIKEGVQAIPNVEFEETAELGRVNRVDPLGITYMRIRGMWGIDNPLKVFSYVYERPEDARLSLMCIIDIEKWNTFDNRNILVQLSETNDGLCIEDVRIKDPDNPARLVDAKLITYSE